MRKHNAVLLYVRMCPCQVSSHPTNEEKTLREYSHVRWVKKRRFAYITSKVASTEKVLRNPFFFINFKITNIVTLQVILGHMVYQFVTMYTRVLANHRTSKTIDQHATMLHYYISLTFLYQTEAEDGPWRLGNLSLNLYMSFRKWPKFEK